MLRPTAVIATALCIIAPTYAVQVAVTIPAGAIGKMTAAFGTFPLNVNTGDTVTWTNTDSAPHTVTSDAGSSELGSSTLSNGNTYTHTFNTAGTFPYFCTIHGQASMSGEVVVKSLVAATSAPAAASGGTAGTTTSTGTASSGSGTTSVAGSAAGTSTTGTSAPSSGGAYGSTGMVTGANIAVMCGAVGAVLFAFM